MNHLFFALRTVFLTATLAAGTAAWGKQCAVSGVPEKIIHMVGNFAVDTAAAQLAIVDRARAKGANTVIFSDTKVNNWALDNSVGTRWFTEMRSFYDGVKARDMKFVFETIAIGYCSSMLASAPDLTTGYPVREQPLRAFGGSLVPVNTAAIGNGGFESFTGNAPDGWDYQDAAGVRTFVDTIVKRSGKSSFRADARDGANSRVMTTLTVKPWHQYRVRFWMKAENLSANYIAALMLDSTSGVALSSQSLSFPQAENPEDRDYIRQASNLQREWTEVMVTFNSQNTTSLRFALSVFGGTSGSVWWDDVSIEDVPTLNWLQRGDLPRSAKLANGSSVLLGSDMSEPIDPKLGKIGYPGRYGYHHQPTLPSILNAAKIREGDTVYLSGYHGLAATEAQTACSWNTPAIISRMRNVHEKIQQTFQPDGYLLNYDEIRTGGFEPADLVYANSGAALAASIEKAYKDLFSVAPNARHYFWSDMVDPAANAVANFYQVNNTLDGSWKTLKPAKVTMLTWWSGSDIESKGPASLKFFSDLGFKQVIGAFYDEDVALNHQRWQAAKGNLPNIIGGMYTTWTTDYSKIEAFGDWWWK